MMRFLFPPVGHIINVWSEVYFLGLTWRGVGTNLFQDWDGKFSLATSFKEADHELCLWTLPIPNHCQTLTVAQHKYIASLIDLLIWILKKSKCPISKSLIIVFFSLLWLCTFGEFALCYTDILYANYTNRIWLIWYIYMIVWMVQSQAWGCDWVWTFHVTNLFKILWVLGCSLLVHKFTPVFQHIISKLLNKRVSGMYPCMIINMCITTFGCSVVTPIALSVCSTIWDPAT